MTNLSIGTKDTECVRESNFLSHKLDGGSIMLIVVLTKELTHKQVSKSYIGYIMDKIMDTMNKTTAVFDWHSDTGCT